MTTDPLSFYSEEWRRFVAGPAASATLKRWAERAPALAGVSDVSTELRVARVARDFDRTDHMLHALLVVSASRDSAATTASIGVAAHLVPGAVRIALQVQSALSRAGQTTSFADVRATVAGCLWEETRTFPLRRTHAVAANVLGDVLAMALRAHDCHPRVRGRGLPTSQEELDQLGAGGTAAVMQESEELLHLLAWARVHDRLTAPQTELLLRRWTTESKPVSTRQLGAEMGCSQRTAARRCAEAELALALAVAA